MKHNKSCRFKQLTSSSSMRSTETAVCTKQTKTCGAAGRLDPAQVRLTTLNQTHGDGLARAVRRGLRARGLRPELRVVFSDEPVRPATRDVDAGRAAHGVIGYLPALFGVMLGGEIVRCLLAGEVR